MNACSPYVLKIMLAVIAFSSSANIKCMKERIAVCQPSLENKMFLDYHQQVVFFFLVT